MSTSNNSTVVAESLLELILSSAQEAMAIYKSTGNGVPSLDAVHPLDSSLNVLALKKAIRTLEGACEQLCSTLAPPGHTILNVSVLI
jgi:hypothetical protein